MPITVNDDSDFLSVFSESEAPLIAADVADYIESRTDDIPADEPLAFKVYSNCIDPEEQEQTMRQRLMCSTITG